MKKVALTQSSYIPWKGYFDLINMVDEFILFDSVQYVKKSWRNRNYIKGANGPLLLSIPVLVKGKLSQRVRDVIARDDQWRKKHWKAFVVNYSKSQYFSEYKDIFEALYLKQNVYELSTINYHFIKTICELLGITTQIKYDTDYNYFHENANIDKIIELLQCAQTEIFINGPTAQQYMTKEMFAVHNIDLQWMDYDGYPEYTQLHPPFEHHVSILDLLFNEGPNANKFLKSF
ncbi:MAG: WbqC family protein [Proteobacteria bacterium]|nr:WbqC family protein [Pseudomonadota bacterium]